MKITTVRFGELDLDEARILRFPAGLIGMPQRRKFALLEFDRELPLAWLQGADDADFGLPVAEPMIFGQDYRVEIPREDVAALELHSEEDATLLIVTTIHAGGAMVTGNLRAPLVINSRTLIGRQIILDRIDLEMRAFVDPIAFSQASWPELIEAIQPDVAPLEV